MKSLFSSGAGPSRAEAAATVAKKNDCLAAARSGPCSAQWQITIAQPLEYQNCATTKRRVTRWRRRRRRRQRQKQQQPQHDDDDDDDMTTITTTTTTTTTMMTTMTTATETTTATTRWYNDTTARSLNPNAFKRLKLSTFNDAWQEFVHFLQ